MPGRVFVTGGSGLVGSAVLEELLSRRFSVDALVNRAPLRISGDAIRAVEGSLFDPKTLDEGLRGCDAVIHLVGIIMEHPSKGITFERMHFEGTKAAVDAAKRAGVRRYIHMSALGTRPDARSNYHKTKYRAEQYVRASGLDWTIFRPSAIHGPGGIMEMEANWARRKSPPFLFMPYFGAGALGLGGAGLLQPIYVRDVARAFVDAMENTKTIHEVYPIGGPEQFTWPQFHHAASEIIVGKRRWAIPIPAWLAEVLTKLAPQRLLGFNHDQVLMSGEDNTCDMTKFKDDFGWEPRPLKQTLQTYRKDL